MKLSWNGGLTVGNRFCIVLLRDERDMTRLFTCQQEPDNVNCRFDTLSNESDVQCVFHHLTLQWRQRRKMLYFSHHSITLQLEGQSILSVRLPLLEFKLN